MDIVWALLQNFVGSYSDNFVVFFVSILLAHVFLWWIRKKVGSLVEKITVEILTRAASPPIASFFVVSFSDALPLAGWFVTCGILWVTSSSSGVLGSFLTTLGSLMILIGFGVLGYNAVRFVELYITNNTRTPKAAIGLLISVLRIFVLFSVLFAGLQRVGFDLGTVLAGAGLLGIAVALGAQDLFKNFISGILIIIERRFNVGDYIALPGQIEGTVDKIGLRSCVILHMDHTRSYIPNSLLGDGMVQNVSARDYRELKWIIQLDSNTTAPKIEAVITDIKAYLGQSDEFSDDSESFVTFESFTNGRINLLVWVFPKKSDFADYSLTRENLALEVIRSVERHDVRLFSPISGRDLD